MRGAATANGDAGGTPRSAAEIEQEISRTRRRLGLTLDRLAQQLAPRRLVQKGLEMTARFAGRAKPAPTDGKRRFRGDLPALCLIGAGVAWLVMANSGLLRRNESDGVGKRNAGLGEEQIPECAGATDGVAAAEGPSKDGRRPADSVDSNPLLFGVLGLAAGAALAALLPASRREQQLIAQAREDLWQKAETLGHQTAAQIRNFNRCSTAAAAKHSPAE
jgi:Protein of unknown function (DUF3618)